MVAASEVPTRVSLISPLRPTAISVLSVTQGPGDVTRSQGAYLLTKLLGQGIVRVINDPAPALQLIVFEDPPRWQGHLQRDPVGLVAAENREELNGDRLRDTGGLSVGQVQIRGVVPYLHDQSESALGFDLPHGVELSNISRLEVWVVVADAHRCT